jgi:hypothetical protein
VDLDSPALVVGEVELQHVQPVGRGEVDEPQHVVLGQEVPRDVQQHAAPLEARVVLDTHYRQLERAGAAAAVGIWTGELAQGLGGGVRAGEVRGVDPDQARGAHVDAVAAGRQVGGEGERDRAVPTGRRGNQVEAERLLRDTAPPARGGPQRGVGADARAVLEPHRSARRLRRRRLRDESRVSGVLHGVTLARCRRRRERAIPEDRALPTDRDRQPAGQDTSRLGSLPSTR